MGAARTTAPALAAKRYESEGRRRVRSYSYSQYDDHGSIQAAFHDVQGWKSDHGLDQVSGGM